MRAFFPDLTKKNKAYDVATWDYEIDKEDQPVTDPTLNHPRCVLQLMKALFARYTPEMVTATRHFQGSHPQDGHRLRRHRPAEKSGTIIYAMGATQHSTGVQMIRGYSVLQLLLGNMGVPGGGINALRGENNVQGSTDMAFLFNMVPGYLIAPHGSRLSHPEGLSGQKHPQGQLFDQYTEILCQPAKGLLGRRRQTREQLRL